MLNTEMLEQLLIDRSLGQLSAEVAALLEAYLDRDAAARAEAEAVEKTVRLARRAVAGRVRGAPPLPPLDRGWLERDGHVAVRRRGFRAMVAVGGAGALAACVAAGFFLGQRWAETPVAVMPPQGSGGHPSPAVAGGLGGKSGGAGGGVTQEGVTDFWSVQRLRMLAMRNDMARRAGGELPAGETPAARLFHSNGG